MNIFQRIFKKALPQKFTSTASSRWALQFGGMYAGFLKKKDYIDEYKNWVYACVNQRAEAIANIKLILKRGEEIIDSHEVLDLINKVNNYTTKYQLFFNTQAFKDLDGNAYWYLARDNDGKGKIQEIHLLQPNKMLIVQSKENPMEIAGYVFSQQDGTKIPFAKNEILHIKNFNAFGYFPFPHKGMSVVEGAQWAVDTDNEIRTWNYNFFKNGARPDGILTSSADGSIDEDSYKRLKEQWSAEHQGSENAHKTAILTGGMTWTKVGNSQQELDFARQKELNRDEIASLFKVPKFMLGVTDNINRATAESAIFVFSLFTVKPLMQQIVDTINEFLLPEYGEDLTLDFESPVSEDRANVVLDYTASLNNWRTRNEIRLLEGLPPTKEGDQFFTPANLTPTDVVIPVPEKKRIEKPKEKKAKTSTEKTIEAFIAKLPKSKSKGLSVEQKESFKVNWKALIEQSTTKLKKQLVKYFDKQKSEVLKNLRSELRGLEASEFKFKSIGDFLFDEDNAIQTGISLITPNIREYLQAGGDAGANLTGTVFDMTTKRIADFLVKRAEYFAKTINETTITDLQDNISAGISAGESIDEISNRVADVYSKATDFRTDMIARTEVSASQNFGAMEAYQQAGLKKMEWTVVNPCEDCQQNEGVVEPIGVSFPSGDSQPPAHPNCVCGLLPVFDNE